MHLEIPKDTQRYLEAPIGTNRYLGDSMIDCNHKLTSRLVGSLCNEDRVLVLCPSVDVVDVVGAVVGIVDPLPAKRQLALVAVLRSLLLHSGQSGVQPVRGACG